MDKIEKHLKDRAERYEDFKNLLDNIGVIPKDFLEAATCTYESLGYDVWFHTRVATANFNPAIGVGIVVVMSYEAGYGASDRQSLTLKIYRDGKFSIVKEIKTRREENHGVVEITETKIRLRHFVLEPNYEHCDYWQCKNVSKESKPYKDACLSCKDRVRNDEYIEKYKEREVYF